jgi:4-hydroxy-3-methylbut-2-en-1-yl diphosphate reductase
MLTNIKVKIAQYAGACYGVNRALQLTNDAIKSEQKVLTYGEIIHNPQVVEDLRNCGVDVIHDPKEARGCVVLRSHGIAPQIEDEIREKANVVDATCPFVKKAQIVAKNLGAKHNQVVIVGEQGHPEVEALRAYAKLGGAVVYVVAKVSDMADIKFGDVGILSQTTQSMEAFQKIVSEINVSTKDVEVKNTICDATAKRQASAIKLAKQVDAMVVLGGRNSANTTRLFKLCKHECDLTWQVERFSEFERLAEIINESINCNTKEVLIGITAGASTPEKQIEELSDYLENNL